MKIRFIAFALCITSNLLYAQNEKYLDITTCPFQFGTSITITNRGDSLNHPKISPNGEKVIVSKNYNGVYIIELENPSNIITVTSEHMAGFDAKWTSDGNEIKFKKYSRNNNGEVTREPYKYSIQQNSVKNDEFSVSNSINISAKRNISVTLNLKRSIVEAFDGTKTWDITKEPKVYYEFTVSPDQSKVLIHEGGKMYVYAMDGSGMICSLGNGICQSWSPDGKYLVYFLSKDGEYEVIDSDIYICTWDGSRKWKMTNTPDKIEMWPSWSSEGDIIIYDEKKSGTVEFVRILHN